MRVAFTQTYEKMTLNINRNKEDLDRYAAMVATGERLQKPADDPLGWARAVDLRQGIREFESLQKNVNFAQEWNEATESALTGLGELIIEAKKAGSGFFRAQTPENQQAFAGALDGIIREAVSLANSQYGDRYLFSGQQFSTTPFGMQLDANGNVTGITGYFGDNGSFDVRTGKGTSETVNVDGETAFGQVGNNNVLEQLLALKTAILNGDTAGTQQQLVALDTSFQNLSRLWALAESREAGLERKKDLLSCLNLGSQAQLSEVADANMVEAIAQLQQSQTVYEAALRATASLSKLNLTQFL